MAKAEGIPPTASVVVPGLSLNYAGEWAFAYSGEVGVANIELSLLEFTTGAGIIVGEMQVGSKNAENEDYEMKIYFNDLIIFANTFHQQGTSYVDIPSAVPLIIPPFTLVKATMDNIADTDTRNWTMGLTGRVYDV